MSKIFDKDNVFLTDKKLTWKEAIKLCARPLLDDDYIDESYIDSIFKQAEKIGPYFDFGQGIAVPHSRPEDGVNKTGAALLKVSEPVLLMDDKSHPIDVFIVFGSSDSYSHIDVLKEISEVFGDKDKLAKIKAAKSKDEILNVFGSEE